MWICFRISSQIALHACHVLTVSSCNSSLDNALPLISSKKLASNFEILLNSNDAFNMSGKFFAATCFVLRMHCKIARMMSCWDNPRPVRYTSMSVSIVTWINEIVLNFPAARSGSKNAFIFSAHASHTILPNTKQYGPACGSLILEQGLVHPSVSTFMHPL